MICWTGHGHLISRARFGLAGRFGGRALMTVGHSGHSFGPRGLHFGLDSMTWCHVAHSITWPRQLLSVHPLTSFKDENLDQFQLSLFTLSQQSLQSVSAKIRLDFSWIDSLDTAHFQLYFSSSAELRFSQIPSLSSIQNQNHNFILIFSWNSSSLSFTKAPVKLIFSSLHLSSNSDFSKLNF